MSRWLKATFASSAFVLICVFSFLQKDVRADDIVITSGTSSEGGTFITSSLYISWRAQITNNYFGAGANAFNEESQAGCDFPYGVRSPFKVKNNTGPFTTTPISSVLHIEGQNYGKWFRGSGIGFDLDGVVIPVEGASTFTRVKQSMLFGTFWFSEYDRPTGFEPVTMIPYGHPQLGFFSRYADSLPNTGVNQRTGPTPSDSSEARPFNFSGRTKPVAQEHLPWPVGSGFPRVFAPRIPVQFWRRISFEDKTIIPAAAIQIRGKGDEAPNVANGRIRR
jgi:hypothetical protein